MRCGKSCKFKIGVSGHPEKRVAQLQTGNPEKIQLLFCAPCHDAYGVEGVIHKFFKEKGVHLSGEWSFSRQPLVPCTKWFHLDSDDEVVSLAQLLLKKSEQDELEAFAVRFPPVPTHTPVLENEKQLINQHDLVKFPLRS